MRGSTRSSRGISSVLRIDRAGMLERGRGARGEKRRTAQAKWYRKTHRGDVTTTDETHTHGGSFRGLACFYKRSCGETPHQHGRLLSHEAKEPCRMAYRHLALEDANLNRRPGTISAVEQQPRWPVHVQTTFSGTRPRHTCERLRHASFCLCLRDGTMDRSSKMKAGSSHQLVIQGTMCQGSYSGWHSHIRAFE
ncbi:hypothetical protein LY76DRAFT_79764 [Colletotrichum caudatum]|nr:hypothetical protein LY76DRAFT_79764 [Colletotrichum caudatum]